MKGHCKHSGLPLPPGDPYGGFCCAGCREVYALIHDSGYEDYYQMQDRVGRAVSGLDFEAVGVSKEEFWSAARQSEGLFVTTLFVAGMTCRGCSWLVQRIALREPHVFAASVSLVTGRLELRHGANFDFQAFQERLSHFAYRLSTRAALGGLSLSPILVRLVLTMVFALNGALIAFAESDGIGGESLAGIFQLLSIVNLLLIAFVGGGVFIKTAWDGWRFRQFHSDVVPALSILLLSILALGEILSLLPTRWFSCALFLLLPVLIISRVLAEFFETRVRADRANTSTLDE